MRYANNFANDGPGLGGGGVQFSNCRDTPNWLPKYLVAI